MAWLLDTNIISETRRLKPEPKVLAFIADHPLEELYISTVTIAELRFGIGLLSKDDSRRKELNDWLTHEIRPVFERRILPITEDVMLRWRFLVDEGRKDGHTLFTARPDHCSRGALLWPHGSDPRPSRLRPCRCAGDQSAD